VLVIAAALLMHSVRTLRSDPGFDVEHVAYFRMKPRLSGYDQEKASSYFRSVQHHLESLGEVESVAFVRFPPTLPPGTVPVVPVFLPQAQTILSRTLWEPCWWEQSLSRRAQYLPGAQGSIRWWLCVTSKASGNFHDVRREPACRGVR
jgi:hypothetical protein